MHLLHLCARIHQVRKVPASDIGWEDMYHEEEGNSWFDWVHLPHSLSILLLILSHLDYTHGFPSDSGLCLQHSIPLFSHKNLPLQP